MPLGGRSLRFVFSAAGFIATRTFGWSPGVRMSWSAKWSWKPETPGSEPAGARISAGKSGKVARSLPTTAVSEVKRSPVSCMPSPESPANRMITRWSCSTVLATSSSCSAEALLGANATNGQAPGLAALEELVRIDVVQPADEVRRRIVGRAAEHGRAALGGLLRLHAAAQLV